MNLFLRFEQSVENEEKLKKILTKVFHIQKWENVNKYSLKPLDFMGNIHFRWEIFTVFHICHAKLSGKCG